MRFHAGLLVPVKLYKEPEEEDGQATCMETFAPIEEGRLAQLLSETNPEVMVHATRKLVRFALSCSSSS